MGKIFTYGMEGDASHRFHEMRSKAVEDHMVFDGNEYEGEFCKSFPHTCMELKGLYTIDDGMLSIFVTEVPKDVAIDSVEDLFQDLLDTM